MNLQQPFTLSGKIDNLWKQVTNNQWKNMLNKSWTDKGFHFFERIKTRGPSAGISSPSNLESEIRKGTVLNVTGNRYKITLILVNSIGQHFTIFYDYDSKKKLCQLVTCSYE
ncbi:hypothetical protein ABWH96_16895 [Marivirga tractuosa]|uniref:hypothetical protein n=1 Tax=Marivirga tractuosa TaxID=1006 RepID=UPI0035D0E11D